MDSPAPTPTRLSVLFVCTGNTCRSPLAEAMCKRMLADLLGCEPADLPARGVVVRSAGVMTFGGEPASPQAVPVAAEWRADLSGHCSRPVSPELLAEATDVVAMTRSHLLALAARFPNLGPPPRLLCDEFDLPDPIGGDEHEYRACARLIADSLSRLIRGWLGS